MGRLEELSTNSLSKLSQKPISQEKKEIKMDKWVQ